MFAFLTSRVAIPSSWSSSIPQYIIPLAKKLADCGVFGVSSFEYLNYAQKNRDQWAREGEAIVKEMLAEFLAEKV